MSSRSSSYRHGNQGPSRLFALSLMLILLLMTGCSWFGGGNNAQSTPTPGGNNPAGTGNTGQPTGMPHVQGSQIVDANGKPFLLHGAQVESPFAYIDGWQKGRRPTKTVPARTFQIMAQQWHMNVVRLPLSNWIYASAPDEFMSQLDQIVQEANDAGLYTILDLHDNNKGGSPYGNQATLPKTEDVTFWKAIAAHFKDNPMVMFDVYNEPAEPDWDTWMHGGGNQGGATIVGMPDLVNAIRSTGAKQIIVVEPGSAGKDRSILGKLDPNAKAEEGGWSSFPTEDILSDPNIVYSLHVYEGITAASDQLDGAWGPLLNHNALLYGEWAFLPNAQGNAGLAHCKNLPTASNAADQVVNNFLNYAAQRNISWIAWEFAPHYLVQNYNTYNPTTLDVPFSCGDSTTTNVGMGQLIKNYLASHQ